MDPFPPDSPTRPSDRSSSSKAAARRKENERREAYQQARGWHILYNRPFCVTFAGVTMATVGVLALGSAPFVGAYETMHGYLAVIGRDHSIVPTLVLLGVFLTTLGLLINRARNWARWSFALIAAGWLGWAAYNKAALIQVVPACLYLGYLWLLFNPKANRFFRKVW